MEEIVKSRILGVLALLVLAFALTACNGSSGSDSSSSSSSSSGGGSVAAAPLMSAKVYGTSASNEAILIGTTDSNGAFTANANVNKLTFPAIVYSVGGITKHTQKEFGGKLKGVLESPNGKVYLTPANTFVAEIYEAMDEDTKDLKEAQRTVRRLIQVEMGLSQDTDPLGDPLGANLVNSETVSKNLLMQIAAGDEDNKNSMQLLDSKITALAKKMVNNDESFAEALKATPGTPLAAATGKTLNELILAPETVESIKKQVTDALGDENVDTAELEKCTKAEKTKDVPTSLFLEIKKGAEETILTRAVTVSYNGSDISFATPVELQNASGDKITDAQYKATFTNLSVTASSHVVKNGDIFTLADDGKLIFKVIIPEEPTFPMEASITIEAVASTGSFSKTFVVTCIGKTDFAVEKVEYVGSNKVFEFGTEFNSNGLIKAGESAEVDSDDFKGLVTLINETDKNDIDGNIDVRFTAPQGFVFDCDNSVVKSFDAAENTTKYYANPICSTITAATDIQDGVKTIKIEVINNDGDIVKSATKELAFVGKGASSAIIDTNLTEITSSIKGDIKDKTILEVADKDLTSNGQEKTFNSNKIVLKGEYQTWQTKMGVANATKWNNIQSKAEVWLVSTSGKKPFKDAHDAPTNKLVVPHDKVTFSDSEFSLDATIENFSYTFTGENVYANDDIKLVLIYDSKNTKDNTESSTLFKLRFTKP